MPPYNPELLNEDIRDRLTQSIAELTYSLSISLTKHAPAVILRVQEGCHCLLFEGSLIKDYVSGSRVCQLRFPNNDVVEFTQSVMELIKGNLNWR